MALQVQEHGADTASFLVRSLLAVSHHSDGKIQRWKCGNQPQDSEARLGT